MIIDKLHVVCAVLPPKTDSPLVIDANAVLAGAIARELFQAIAGRDPQVLEVFGGINEPQFAEHESVELGRETSHSLSAEESFRVAAAETVNHWQ